MSQKKRFAVVVCENDPKWNGAEGIGRDLVEIFKSDNDEWAVFKACEGEQPTEEDIKLFDGFLITGSASSVNDNKQWMSELEKFIKALAKSTTKAVGLCFGHQLIGKALGGRVGRNPSQRFVFQAEDIRLSDELIGETWSKDYLGSKSNMTLLESHSEAITEPPIGAKLLGQSDSCETEVMLCGDHENILGIQSHPEITAEQMKRLILPALKNKNVLTVEEEAFSVESMEKSLDSEIMLNILKNFLHQ